MRPGAKVKGAKPGRSQKTVTAKVLFRHAKCPSKRPLKKVRHAKTNSVATAKIILRAVISVRETEYAVTNTGAMACSTTRRKRTFALYLLRGIRHGKNGRSPQIGANG